MILSGIGKAYTGGLPPFKKRKGVVLMTDFEIISVVVNIILIIIATIDTIISIIALIFKIKK